VREGACYRLTGPTLTVTGTLPQRCLPACAPDTEAPRCGHGKAASALVSEGGLQMTGTV
jgi:hypothetical protein